MEPRRTVATATGHTAGTATATAQPQRHGTGHRGNDGHAPAHSHKARGTRATVAPVQQPTNQPTSRHHERHGLHLYSLSPRPFMYQILYLPPERCGPRQFKNYCFTREGVSLRDQAGQGVIELWPIWRSAPHVKI